MAHTKTGGPPHRIILSLDAPLPEGGTLHDRVPDRRVWPYDDDYDDDIDDDLDVLAAVLEASIGMAPASELVSPRLSQVFFSSITANRTRQLLQSIYENGGDQALRYIFGLEDGRQLFARTPLEPLEPACRLWSSGAAKQNARKLLDRAQATLRTNLLVASATHDEELFLRFLFRFGLDEGWRGGTVDRLSAGREQLDQQAPEQAAALSELTRPALDRAIARINDFRFRRKIRAGAVPLFTSIYAALRYVGLFSRQGTEAADILHSASSKLPQDGSAETLMLQRALERPLHLLEVPEEWDAFIARLLDWIEGDGAVFAVYTACYYLDSLDAQSWQGMVNPFSIERAWTNEALHAVLEESNKNLDESRYLAPHHAAINTLRALNYLRAHPNPTLGHREWIICLRLARAGIAAASQLSHPRVSEVRQWSERLERGLLCARRGG